MTIVVSDASPLNYLIWIGCDFILPELYGAVLIPTVVIQELHTRRRPKVFEPGYSIRPHGRRFGLWAARSPLPI